MRSYDSPLLITGSPRSGTSALRRTLMKMSSDVSLSGEWGSFLAKPYTRMRQLSNNRPEFYLNHPLHWRGSSWNAQSFIDYLQVPRTPHQIHTVAYGENAVYGDKLPIGYLTQGKQILVSYPGTRFIVTLRDGRDVVTSQLRANSKGKRGHWAQYDSAAKAQGLWLRCMQSWETLKPQLTPDQYMELRYEEAVADPLVKLREVVDFAGIAVTAAELKAAVQGYRPTHVGAWRTEQPDIMSELGAPFKEMLQKWNYL